jgi:hypothetical protein
VLFIEIVRGDCSCGTFAIFIEIMRGGCAAHMLFIEVVKLEVIVRVACMLFISSQVFSTYSEEFTYLLWITNSLHALSMPIITNVVS